MSSLLIGFDNHYLTRSSSSFQSPKTHHLCYRVWLLPESVSAEVTVEGGFKNVNAGSGWSQNGDMYTQEGEGPTLTFVIEMGAGNLTLTK